MFICSLVSVCCPVSEKFGGFSNLGGSLNSIIKNMYLLGILLTPDYLKYFLANKINK